MALRRRAPPAHDVRGATAWVTLEPCAHHGRTPPCCDALIEAGIARVVVAIDDPNPRVAGQGIARLRAAGIEVDGGRRRHRGTAARELNIGFFSRMLRGRPWVRMKVAASLDGRTALPNGASQWITGEAARADGHAWRRRAGAVLTGIGTVLDDDPRLDVRHVPTALQPLRVVVDSRLETPADGAPARSHPGRCCLRRAATKPARRRARCAARGVEVAACRPTPRARSTCAAMLRDLARRGINELHVEAGDKLNALAAARRPGRRVAGLPGAHAARAGAARWRRFGPLAALDRRLALRVRRRANASATICACCADGPAARTGLASTPRPR